MDQNLQEDSAYKQMPGDLFWICNATVCVRYSRSDDVQNYIGGPRTPVTGGSGCAPKCTGGTVIVREPGKA